MKCLFLALFCGVFGSVHGIFTNLLDTSPAHFDVVGFLVLLSSYYMFKCNLVS